MIETPNGDRYVVLPNGMLAAMGNRQLERSTGLINRNGRPCKILGKIALYPYLNPGDEDFQRDWDVVQGIERIMVPLPKGCTCGHAAIMAVLTCPVHDVRFGFR